MLERFKVPPKRRTYHKQFAKIQKLLDEARKVDGTVISLAEHELILQSLKAAARSLESPPIFKGMSDRNGWKPTAGSPASDRRSPPS